MPNRRDGQKAATRQKLIKFSKELIIEKGVDDLQIADITERAGVSQGAFYVHFENKEELFNFLKDDFNDSMLKVVISAFDGTYGSIGRMPVKDIASVFLDKLKENKVYIVIHTSRYGFSLPYHNQILGVNPAMIEFLAGEIEKIQGHNGKEPFDSIMLTHAILAMWLRIGFRYALLDDYDKQEALSMILRLTEASVKEFLSESIYEKMC